MGTQTAPPIEHLDGLDSDQPEIQIEQPSAAKANLEGIVEETIRRKADELRVEEARFVFQQKRARMFAASGLFGKESDDPRYKLSESKAIAQSMVRIDIGESMGFSAAESMQGIDIISNRAAISAALRASRMQSCGYTWDLEWHSDEKGGCTGLTVWGKYKGKPLLDRAGNQVSVAYLKADAERMLTTITEWKGGVKSKRRASILEKDNWQMTPKNMYFARAITNFQRWYAPGVLSINLPSIEEAMDFDEQTDMESDAGGSEVRGSVEAARAVAAEKLAKMGIKLDENGDAVKTVGVMIPRDETGAPIEEAKSEAKPAESALPGTSIPPRPKFGFKSASKQE